MHVIQQIVSFGSNVIFQNKNKIWYVNDFYSVEKWFICNTDVSTEAIEKFQQTKFRCRIVK